MFRRDYLFFAEQIANAVTAHPGLKLLNGKNPMEIFLYGSVARGDSENHDIDLMIVNDLIYRRIVQAQDRIDLGYGVSLAENFYDLMGWLEMPYPDVSVDLHLLPVEFLRDQNARCRLAQSQPDPDFYQNVFRDALVFDRYGGKFLHLNRAWLEEEFGCDLADLFELALITA